MLGSVLSATSTLTSNIQLKTTHLYNNWNKSGMLSNIQMTLETLLQRQRYNFSYLLVF